MRTFQEQGGGILLFDPPLNLGCSGKTAKVEMEPQTLKTNNKKDITYKSHSTKRNVVRSSKPPSSSRRMWMKSRQRGPVAKRHARGNALTDEAANQGVLAHPVLARGDTSLSAYARKLRSVALTIASTCRRWPRSNVTNGILTRRRWGRVVAAATVVGGYVSSEHVHDAQPRLAAHASHYLLRADRVIFCGVCGAFSENRLAAKLVQPCHRADTAQAKRQRVALISGKHPATGMSLPKAECVLPS